MKRTPVNSSMVASLGYDAQTQILEVEFVSDATVYQYKGVSKSTFQALLSAPSKGKFMKTHIINQYDSVKV